MNNLERSKNIIMNQDNSTNFVIRKANKTKEKAGLSFV